MSSNVVKSLQALESPWNDRKYTDLKLHHSILIKEALILAKSTPVRLWQCLKASYSTNTSWFS